jgi:hypothetical protein
MPRDLLDQIDEVRPLENVTVEAKQSEDEDKAKASRGDDSSVTLCFQIADEKTVEDEGMMPPHFPVTPTS